MGTLSGAETIEGLWEGVARERGQASGAWRASWDSLWTRVRGVWPDFGVEAPPFARHMISHLPADADPETLEGINAEELFLAFALVSGDDAALRVFERDYVRELHHVARKIDPGSSDEVVQRLRDRMLVGPKAKLRDYSGAGSLRRWLKVAAKRLALDLQRAAGRRRESTLDGEGGAAMVAEVDPELNYIKAHYREEFREAFAEAMKSLDTRSRTMLKLHMVHRLSIDEIAPMQQVHRATAARWIQKAREELADKTRAALSRRIGVATDEVDSVIHMIASRLDVTVARHLQSQVIDIDDPE